MNLVFRIMSKNLFNNREISKDFYAYESQRHITKIYWVFQIVIEIYQEQDAFMRLPGVLFALWAGNTKPVMPPFILARNRKSRDSGIKNARK